MAIFVVSERLVLYLAPSFSCDSFRASSRAPGYLDFAPFAYRALPMAGDATFCRIDVLFRHQPECQCACTELDWDIGIAADFLTVHCEGHLVTTAVVGYLEMAHLPGCIGVAHLLEEAKEARTAVGRDIGNPGERKLAVNRGDGVVADEKIQRRAGREIQHIEGYESVVKIARRPADDGRAEIDREGDGTSRRRRER